MRWSPIEPTKSPLVETEPYYLWRLGAGATRCGPNPLRPVIIRLEKGKTAIELERWAQSCSPVDEPALRVPFFYKHMARELEGARWCTGLATPEFFKLLETDEESRNLISRVAVLSEIPPPDKYAYESTDEDLGKRGQSTNWPKGSVVIGIIDFGFAFAHERFRLTPTTTRIEYLWVQDAPCAHDAARAGSGLLEAPARFTGPVLETWSEPEGERVLNPVPYGREICAADINHWLSPPGGTVDEDALYCQAATQLGRRWLRSVSRRMAHGTHVLDLATGYRLDESEREQRPIICVQLPEATVADTSGASLDSYVLDGIRYILKRADEIAERANVSRLPAVINFSSGEVAGPHDGSSDLEQAIDELIELRSKMKPFEVVISAGNSHLSRLHAQVEFENAERPVDLRLRMLPDDGTPSFLEIWHPTSPSALAKEKSRIGLQVTTPGGLSSGWLDESTPGAGIQLLSDDDEVLCEARYCYNGQPTERGMFLVSLQPTLRNDPTYPGAAANTVAPSGTWIVSLKNGGLGKDELAEAWIQWDDVPLGFLRRGRQSYFDEECYKRFDAQGREIEEDKHPEQLTSPCHMKRAGSMNAIATGRKTIVVGGSMGDEVRPAKYSAGGPITRAAGSLKVHRHGPDVTAVSDDSLVHLGVLAAGTRSGSVVAMNGTSVAAPQTTREVARVLAASSAGQVGVRADDQPRGRDEIVKRLQIVKHARRSQLPSAAPDQQQPGKERTGAGCVKTERSPGVSTRGAPRFERREQASSGESVMTISYLPTRWTYALAELEDLRSVRARPGRNRIRVDLPWGTWTSFVIVPDSGKVTCHLPAIIGQPPLRNAAPESTSPTGMMLTTGLTTRGGYFKQYVSTVGEWRVWRLTSPLQDRYFDWVEFGPITAPSIPQLGFATFRDQTLLVKITEKEARVEPFTTRPSVEWDLIVGAARIGELDGEHLQRILKDRSVRHVERAQSEELLFDLALAYAALGARSWYSLAVAIEMLRNVENEIVDVPLLDHELQLNQREPKRGEAAEREALRLLNRSAVPVFRWGIRLGARLLPRGSHLDEIAANLLQASAWTTWRPTRPFAGEVED